MSAAKICEVHFVSKHFRVGFHGFDRAFDDAKHPVVLRPTDGIVDPFPITAGVYESGASKVSQMTGDLWLAVTKYIGKVTDTDFAIGH